VVNRFFHIRYDSPHYGYLIEEGQNGKKG